MIPDLPRPVTQRVRGCPPRLGSLRGRIIRLSVLPPLAAVTAALLLVWLQVGALLRSDAVRTLDRLVDEVRSDLDAHSASASRILDLLEHEAESLPVFDGAAFGLEVRAPGSTSIVGVLGSGAASLEFVREDGVYSLAPGVPGGSSTVTWRSAPLAPKPDARRERFPIEPSLELREGIPWLVTVRAVSQAGLPIGTWRLARPFEPMSLSSACSGGSVLGTWRGTAGAPPTPTRGLRRSLSLTGGAAGMGLALELEHNFDKERRVLVQLACGLLAIAAVLLVLCFWLAQWLAAGITGPIQQLLGLSSALERGDYDYPVRVTTGDELESLARAFDTMRDALRGRMQSLELTELARAVAIRREGDIRGRGLVLSLELCRDSCPVLGDPERLSQALDQLLSNAIRFTPDGGTVILRTRPRAHEVCFEVEDTGIGMPLDVQQRIFDPLYEGKSHLEHRSGTLEFNSSGMGLGLAICRRVVAAHRGHIEVESAPGQGSLFRLSLPRLSECNGENDLEPRAA